MDIFFSVYFPCFFLFLTCVKFSYSQEKVLKTQWPPPPEKTEQRKKGRKTSRKKESGKKEWKKKGRKEKERNNRTLGFHFQN